MVCASYAEIISRGILARRTGRAKEIETAKRYRKLAHEFLQYAIETGDVVGIMPAAVNAKGIIFLNDMMKSIDNNFSNTSILTLKHLEKCVQLRNKPGDWMLRFKEGKF